MCGEEECAPCAGCIYPGAPEFPDDGVDSDCDLTTPSWGPTASVRGGEPHADVVNYAFFTLVPIGMILFWKRRKEANMKKWPRFLGVFLVTALLTGLPPSPVCGSASAQEEPPTKGAEKETKSISLGVPAFLDSIRLSGRIQAMWKMWGESDDTQWGAVGLGDILEDEGFRIPRWRLDVSANLFEHVRFDVTMGESEFRQEHDVNLQDALVTLTYLDYANISIGAGKVAVGRQHLISSKEMAFISRPVLAQQLVIPRLGADPKDFNPDNYNGLGISDRDVGVTLFGRLREGIFKYSFGIYNGTGDYFRGVVKHDEESDFFASLGDYAYALRAEVNPWGDFPSGESGFEKETKVSLGISTFLNDISLSKDFHNRYLGWGIDAAVRAFGVAILGEYIESTQDLVFDDTEIESTTRSGFFVQGGYFVWPHHVEVVYRYEEFDDKSHFEDNGDIKYHTIGVNYYIKGSHNYKVQINYVIRGEDGPQILNDALYTLLQLAF